MHVTEYYDLERTQAEVDFVDVDVDTIAGSSSIRAPYAFRKATCKRAVSHA